jgi:hypothetical protein
MLIKLERVGRKWSCPVSKYYPRIYLKGYFKGRRKQKGNKGCSQDGGGMFFQNVSWLSPDYMSSYVTKMTSFLLIPDSLLHFYDLHISFNIQQEYNVNTFFT